MSCKICGNEEADYTRMANYSLDRFECEKCGVFLISDFVLSEISQDEVKHNQLKSMLYERNIKGYNPIAIMPKKSKSIIELGEFSLLTLNEVLGTFPKNLFEKIDRILILFSKMSRFPGEILYFTGMDDTGLFYTESGNFEELESTLNYMKELNLITGEIYYGAIDIKLTIEGLKRLSEIEKQVVESNQVFVAMWFSEEMNEPYLGAISKAIEANGYIPIRIDKVEHNNKIDDEIIANIKKSKFVVADFTGHRGGVYFEAGYAMGLGLPVIWTCHKDHLKDLHFDTRQYSHLVWETEEELFRLLDNRIKATIVPINAQSKILIER